MRETSLFLCHHTIYFSLSPSSLYKISFSGLSDLLAMERRTTIPTQKGFSEEPPNPMTKKRSNKDTNQRRFSDEQIKLLETMFESETRLEPRKKAEVARELGLQPRQVAIWFQNKRARWRSKQVEQDLRSLKDEYESLVSKFESLKKEKHSLLSKLQELNDALRKAQDEEECNKDGGSSSKNSDPGGNFAKPNFLEVLEERSFYNTTNNNVEDEMVMNTSHQQVDTSLASSSSIENWYRYDIEGIVDQSRAQWLNSWF